MFRIEFDIAFYTIFFRYDFLAPNKDSLPEKYRQKEDDLEENLLRGKDGGVYTPALPETEPLWYMSNSKEHRYNNYKVLLLYMQKKCLGLHGKFRKVSVDRFFLLYPIS